MTCVKECVCIGYIYLLSSQSEPEFSVSVSGSCDYEYSDLLSMQVVYISIFPAGTSGVPSAISQSQTQ
jgi:hypothetical protein